VHTLEKMSSTLIADGIQIPRFLPFTLATHAIVTVNNDVTFPLSFSYPMIAEVESCPASQLLFCTLSKDVSSTSASTGTVCMQAWGARQRAGEATLGEYLLARNYVPCTCVCAFGGPQVCPDMCSTVTV
jgi:hypothetical protein